MILRWRFDGLKKIRHKRSLFYTKFNPVSSVPRESPKFSQALFLSYMVPSFYFRLIIKLIDIDQFFQPLRKEIWKNGENWFIHHHTTSAIFLLQLVKFFLSLKR